MNESNLNSGGADRLGVLVSTACAVHCMLVPVLLAVLPAAGVVMGSEPVEWAFVGLACAIATWSLVRGFRRHRSVSVLVALVVGIGLLLAARGVEHSTEQVVLAAFVSVLGAVCLVYGHLRNLRLLRGRRPTAA